MDPAEHVDARVVLGAPVDLARERVDLGSKSPISRSSVFASTSRRPDRERGAGGRVRRRSRARGRVMAILRAMGPRAEVVRAFMALTQAVLEAPVALDARHGRRAHDLANRAAHATQITEADDLT